MRSHFQFTVIEGGNPYKVTSRDIKNVQRAWLRLMWMPFDMAVAFWVTPFEVATRALRGPNPL